MGRGPSLVLIVLQGIDAAGKDGTIRHVMDAFNPQGCSVVGFKAPSPVELSHDYLWRIHQHAPGGARSPSSTAATTRTCWSSASMTSCRDGWRTATATSTNSSGCSWRRDHHPQVLPVHRPRRAARRLQAASTIPVSAGSSRPATSRSGSAGTTTSGLRGRPRAHLDRRGAVVPVPANRKWFRNLAVAHILGETLDDLHPAYPTPEEGLDGVVIPT